MPHIFIISVMIIQSVTAEGGEQMKRIKSACICQTLHFMLKDGVSNEYNKKQVATEVENYKKSLERSKTKYKIVEEITEDDGSVVIKIIKQYNTSPTGDYLN